MRFLQWLRAVWRHWGVLVTGAAPLALGWISGIAPGAIGRWTSLSSVALGVLVATYLAWNDEAEKVEKADQRLQNLQNSLPKAALEPFVVHNGVFLNVTNDGAIAAFRALVEFEHFGYGSYAMAHCIWEGAAEGVVECRIERGVTRRLRLAEALHLERGGFVGFDDEVIEPYEARFWRCHHSRGGEHQHVDSRDGAFEDLTRDFGSLRISIVSEPEMAEGVKTIRLYFKGDRVSDGEAFVASVRPSVCRTE